MIDIVAMPYACFEILLVIDGADTFVSVQPKHRGQGQGHRKDDMKRVRDLTDDDVLTSTTDAYFHVPLSKSYRGDAQDAGDK